MEIKGKIIQYVAYDGYEAEWDAHSIRFSFTSRKTPTEAVARLWLALNRK